MFTENSFFYLNAWDKEHLQKRLNLIKPLINFLLDLHNAKDKAASIDMSCVTDEGKLLHNAITFTTLSTTENGFPDALEEFFHNFCTFLCAEKSMIEFMLSQK